MFFFKGPIPASKSWLNRALVIQHFNPDININADSTAADVVYLKNNILSIKNENVFFLGEGGTTLRFFTFLISRYPGVWTLKAHSRLLERPQDDLKHLLNQLGVSVELSSEQIVINSSGWKIPEQIICNQIQSSQFISGLLLSSWNLNNDLQINIKKPILSYDYLKMTISLLKQAGMSIDGIETSNELSIRIKKLQISKVNSLIAELDISSVFSLASCAVVNGNVEIDNWNSHSTQPDVYFLEIFKKMGINFEISYNKFLIKKQNHWKGVEVNLANSPDLFPVLSILCALADGPSFLYGAPQLVYKESNRLDKTCELLSLVGCKFELKNDSLKILGFIEDQNKEMRIEFDCDQDHRMAMSAGLLKLKGFNINIIGASSINKSYPDFWNHIGVKI